MAQNEKLIFLLIMLFGFFNHMILFFGQLTIGRMKQFRHEQTYNKRMIQIQKILDDWDTKESMKEKMMQFYSTLWNERSGIKDMPNYFNLLPKPMQKEVTVDIFWEALRHATLFAEADLPFKRAISLVMKSEFYLPGDYIYRTDHYKAKMVYVVSGIIQVISDEDEESSVLSFSSGTVLGEASLLYPTKSLTDVRCVTICELHTLSISNLARVICAHPQEMHRMRCKIFERMEHAKYLLDLKNDDNYDDNSIVWMKARWRQLYKIKV